MKLHTFETLQMRKIILLLSLLITLIYSCKSNEVISEKIVKNEVNYIPNYLKVYESDSLYLIKHYQRSYEILDNLFKTYRPLNTEKYKEFETYISCGFVLNKKINLKDSILKSIENYGSNARYFKYDSLMNLAYKSTNISNEEVINSTKTYRKKLNFKLRDSINKICLDDQSCRQKTSLSNVEIQKTDSINEIKLRNIFSIYKFPSERVIGEFYIDSTDIDLRFVFLHTKKDFRLNFLLPKILDAVKKGVAYPSIYSESYDRHLEQTSGKQLYGSYRLKREKKNVELINEKKIDSIRKSIGLPSMTYDKWRLKIKYGIVSYD